MHTKIMKKLILTILTVVASSIAVYGGSDKEYCGVDYNKHYQYNTYNYYNAYRPNPAYSYRYVTSFYYAPITPTYYTPYAPVYFPPVQEEYVERRGGILTWLLNILL